MKPKKEEMLEDPIDVGGHRSWACLPCNKDHEQKDKKEKPKKSIVREEMKPFENPPNSDRKPLLFTAESDRQSAAALDMKKAKKPCCGCTIF